MIRKWSRGGVALLLAVSGGTWAGCSFDTKSFTFTDEPAAAAGSSGAGGGSAGTSSAGAGGTHGGSAGASGVGGHAGNAGASGAAGHGGSSGQAGAAGSAGHAGTSGGSGHSGASGAAGAAGHAGGSGASGNGGAAGTTGGNGGGGASAGNGGVGGSGAGEAGAGGAEAGMSGAGGAVPCTEGTTSCSGKTYSVCQSGNEIVTVCADTETCDATDGCIHAVNVYAGPRGVCTRMSDDTAVCWGANDKGQMGNGTMSATSTPVRVVVDASGTPLRHVKQMALGANHTCALIDDSTNPPSAVCWGSDAEGQLGDGAGDSSRLMPALNKPASLTSGVASGTAITLSSGDYTTCAIDVAGVIHCWGAGDQGQLGNGTSTATSAIPVAVKVVTGASTVAVGFAHACAIGNTAATTPGVVCWGNAWVGQIGNGVADESTTYPTPQQTKANASQNFIASATDSIAVGGFDDGTAANDFIGSSCVARSGIVFCWGIDFAGQLGIGSYTRNPYATSTNANPGNPLADHTVSKVSVSWGHACALATDGVIGCWGDNANGEIGQDLTTANSTRPVIVGGIAASDLAVGADSVFEQDSEGDPEIDPVGFSCAVSTETSPRVFCWGGNHSGQQGSATVTAGERNSVVMP